MGQRSPPMDGDWIARSGEREWHVRLRWSDEALAAAAYEMTFWYMASVGESVFRDGVPGSAGGTTPAEAGRNAAKRALYYAGIRARSLRERQRAIALYNAYGWGYALGANFVDKRGRRGHPLRRASG